MRLLTDRAAPADHLPERQVQARQQRPPRRLLVGREDQVEQMLAVGAAADRGAVLRRRRRQQLAPGSRRNRAPCRCARRSSRPWSNGWVFSSATVPTVAWRTWASTVVASVRAAAAAETSGRRGPAAADARSPSRCWRGGARLLRPDGPRCPSRRRSRSRAGPAGFARAANSAPGPGSIRPGSGRSRATHRSGTQERSPNLADAPVAGSAWHRRAGGSRLPAQRSASGGALQPAGAEPAAARRRSASRPTGCRASSSSACSQGERWRREISRSSTARSARDPDRLARELERPGKAAELVDQPQLLGLGAGPDPPLGGLVHRVLAASHGRARRRRRRRRRSGRGTPRGAPGRGRRSRRPVLHMSALAPRCTRPQATPMSCHSSRSTGLPANTPIEPVSVPASATILVASIAIQ